MPGVVRRWGSIAFAVAAVLLETGDPASASQNGAVPYSLFNPTPDRKLREFGTDRPDLTEGPFTIDPGRFQVEADLLNYARSRRDEDGTVTEKFVYGASTFRLGVTRDIELGIVLQPYNSIRERMINPRWTRWYNGPDVIQVRPKFNVFGNDTYKNPGATAFGIVPFINIPTVNNGVGAQDFEGGVAFPFAYKLTDKVDIGAMTQFDYIKNDGRSGYHVEYVNSGLVSIQLSEKWTTYFEVFTRFNNEGPHGGIVVVGGGFLYKIKENLQIDFGVNFGVTRASDVINPFVGIAKRF